MVDFGFFDSLIDGVMVFDEDRKVIYCNEMAANLVKTSVRRIIKGIKIYDLIKFENENIFCMPNGVEGKDYPLPTTELKYSTVKGEESGRLQITIQPFHSENQTALWIIVLHDVTLEERLHSKYHAQLEAKEVIIEELKDAKGEIENYSKNLEKMVESRTAEVKRANTMLKAIMNSLGQGFLVFDERGICGDIYTKACEDILEIAPSGRSITQVLKKYGEDTKHIDMWTKAVFSESLPFESLKELGPSHFDHSENRYITLDYYPIREETGKIKSLVMVATDETREREAQLAMEKERQFSVMILKLIKNKEQFSQFLESAKQRIEDVKIQSEGDIKQFDVEECFRILHTLEGEAGVFGAKVILDASRHSQEIIEPLKNKITDEVVTIKEEFSKSIVELKKSYEFFISENEYTFNTLGLFDKDSVYLSKTSLQKFLKFIKEKNISTDIIERFTSQFVNESVESNLAYFNDLSKQVAEKSGKQVNDIAFENCQIRIDVNIFRSLFSSLVHVFRNAVDHGIEEPEVRIMYGKPEAGNIKVRCDIDEELKKFKMLIEDDGGGIDPDLIREKLEEKGFSSEYLAQPNEKIIQGIFEPGFSSRDEVGDFSGRGIGMDAVKTEVIKLGGNIHVESELGKGTKLFIEIPLIQSENIKCAA